MAEKSLVRVDVRAMVQTAQAGQPLRGVAREFRVTHPMVRWRADAHGNATLLGQAFPVTHTGHTAWFAPR